MRFLLRISTCVMLYIAIVQLVSIYDTKNERHGTFIHLIFDCTIRNSQFSEVHRSGTYGIQQRESLFYLRRSGRANSARQMKYSYLSIKVRQINSMHF